MFEKAAIKQWRRTVHKELRGIQLPSEHPTYRAAMVLAAVQGFGTDVAIASEVSGQTEDFVRTVLKRARANRMIVGQSLRVAWNAEYGLVALLLDAMVADGDIVRPPDPKRSAAAKARKRGPDKKPRAKRKVVRVAGAVYTPKIIESNPLYGLPEWFKEKK